MVFYLWCPYYNENDCDNNSGCENEYGSENEHEYNYGSEKECEYNYGYKEEYEYSHGYENTSKTIQNREKLDKFLLKERIRVWYHSSFRRNAGCM